MKFRLSRSFLFGAAVTAAAIFFFASDASAQNVQVNDAPLRDFAKSVKAKIDKKEIDVSRPFSVEMAAVITGDGKLDTNASKFTAESGDPKMIAVAKQAILATGETGYFSYLKDIGITRATLTMSQSPQIFTANVRSEQNAFKARMIASMVGMAVLVGGGDARNPNQKLILENTKASADGGNVNITCTLPAAEFQRMILGNTAAGAPVN